MNPQLNDNMNAQMHVKGLYGMQAQMYAKLYAMVKCTVKCMLE